MTNIKVSFLIIILFSIILLPLLPQAEGAENTIDDGIKLITENLKKDLPIAEGRQIKVAILPFNWEKHDQWVLCRVVCELFRTQFSLTEGVTLAEREATQQAMVNLNPEKGLLKAEDVTKLGKLLGCNFIVTGHVADLNTVININAFLWDAGTGNLISTRSAQIKKTAEIISMIDHENQSDSSELYSVKWRSKPMPYHILGILVSDVDGDGIKDLVILTENEFKVMSWDGFCFVDKASIQYVNIAQLKRNQWNMRTLCEWYTDGQNEIYISVPDVETSVWKWEKDAPVKVGTLAPSLLSIQKDFLVFGQLKRNYFVGQKTYQVSRTDNSRSDRLIPKDYYSLAVGDVNGVEGREWLIVDVDNVMHIYSEDMTQIWQSTATFGSGITIADLDNNGRNEIVGTSDMPQNEKDSLIILEWDGNTYVKKLESQLIDGSITATCVGDPNNDGVDELVVVTYGQNGSEICFYSANNPQ
jgi:TolB-like protein